jgi:hypothetical protein
MHSLRNDFGSIALIAAALLQSPEAGNYSIAAARHSAPSPSVLTHP